MEFVRQYLKLDNSDIRVSLIPRCGVPKIQDFEVFFFALLDLTQPFVYVI